MRGGSPPVVDVDENECCRSAVYRRRRPQSVSAQSREMPGSGTMSGVTLPSPAPASPQPRRIATPSWLDLRLVLGVVLVLAAVLIGAMVVSGASDTYATVAARRDLAAGTIVTGDDVKLAQVRLPGHGKDVYLSHIEDVVGKQLSRAVSSGELVPADAVTKLSAKTTVTVPLAAGAAPDLRRGQRIEIWVSTGTCSSVVLLPDITVQAVHADTGGSFSTGSGGQDVVVSVAPELADRVIESLALDGAQLRAGVLVGPRASTGSALPDLAPCASPTPGR
jgi:hypothetical protein